MTIHKRLNWSFDICLTLMFLAATPALAQKDTFDREALKVRDSVVLKSGSTLYGVVKSEDVDDEGRKYVLFESDSGGLLKLDVSRLLSRGKVKKVDEIDQDYNRFIATVEDVADAHWQLYDWCGDQPNGANRFKHQREFHLERIVQLDPNDTQAKRKLGYVKIPNQDRWVPEHRYHQSLGFVKRGTGWAPIRQSEVDARHEAVESEAGQRKVALRQWQKSAKKSNDAAALRAELFSFCDEQAIPIIFPAARKENRPIVRSMYVEAMGRVPSQTAQKALCVFAVEDKIQAIREQALALLAQDHYNPQVAVSVFATYLANESNANVQRAAFGIGELGNESATLALANALETRHMVKPAGQSGRINTGVGSDGNVNGLDLGGDSKPVIRTVQNAEVANALRRITGENFGFDRAAWQRWYVENHTHHEIQVRR